MIVQKKNIGTAENPRFEPDIPENLEGVVGAKYRPETDDYEITFRDNFQRFIITQRQIAADGVQTAVCKYFSLEPVTYYVDDGEITPIQVEPVDGWAVLEISATSAGRIDVFIEEHQTTIFAL